MNTNVICPTSASEDNHYSLERVYSRLRAPNEETVLLHHKIPLRLGRWLSRQSNHHTSLGPEFGSPYLYKSQAWWYICNPRTSRKGRDRQIPELTRPVIDSWSPHICVYACTHAQTHTQRGKEREKRGKKGALSTLSRMYKFLDWNYWACRMITVILRENLICMERMAIFIIMF